MDKLSVISLSAFCGLIGVLLSQLMTGMFAFVSDRRKQKSDLRNQYRLKKLEIGENFYFINGELLTMIRKNIDYWRGLSNDRSKETLLAMKKEMERLDVYHQQLHTENWKYNLIGIYFSIPFDFSEIERVNRRSRQLYFQVIDLANKIRNTGNEEPGNLYEKYSLAIFQLCSHYEALSAHVQENMTAVRKQLLLEFD